MKNRNVYKDIVMLVAMCGVLFLIIRIGNAWYMEQKSYGFTVSGETELTEAIIAEMKNIKGICRFELVESITVTIELEGYTCSTELKGIDLENYPLKWKEAQESFSMGNTPILFIGKDSFAQFLDRNQHSPGSSEIKKWIETYEKLSVKITDPSGTVRNARIAGIVEEPENIICIEQSQMELFWGKNYQVKEGYMEITGYQNMKKAREILEGAGFSCYEMQQFGKIIPQPVVGLFQRTF